ncbi:MAG: isoprenoid biosynthesis glyoxalase ElbB [Schleiferiaceae bacterium]|jgi:enhancing lycopene biosynthesis protein 2|nr:isoprenoid biosynthesis glyoxalase ElbB [Schleiferiaceae bacterium]
MHVAVLLHGNGVYDGTEIQEAVFTLLALAQNGHTYQCIAPDVNQHHVIDHTKGEEMNETRNVFVESARIARGDIKKVTEINAKDYDALAMPGGFGTAKNITKWAFSGPDGDIINEVKNLVIDFLENKKIIVGMCMSPTTIAKALEGTNYHAKLTVGSTAEASPYEIGAISEGMNSIGAITEMKTVKEVLIDTQNRIITAPCYMMEASITEVHDNIQDAIKAMNSL